MTKIAGSPSDDPLPMPEPWLVCAARWATDRLSLVLQGPGLLLSGLGGLVLAQSDGPDRLGWLSMLTPWAPVMVLVGTVLSAAGVYATEQQKARISRLEQEIAAARGKINDAQQSAFEMGQGYTDVLAAHLQAITHDVSGFDSSARVSLYRHLGDRFSLLGRYSPNPDYRKPGRSHYPEGQGCIGKAWTDGEAEDRLPDPATDSAGYQQILSKRWKIPGSIAKTMRMKSCRIVAFAVENAERTRVGVIVFESTRSDVLESEVLRDVVRGPDGRVLAAFVEKMRPFEASPSVARREGF